MEKFTITIKNTDKAKHKFVLFGYDKYIEYANYGSDVGVQYSAHDEKTPVSYLEVLCLLKDKVFLCENLFIKSSVLNFKNDLKLYKCSEIVGSIDLNKHFFDSEKIDEWIEVNISNPFIISDLFSMQGETEPETEITFNFHLTQKENTMNEKPEIPENKPENKQEQSDPSTPLTPEFNGDKILSQMIENKETEKKKTKLIPVSFTVKNLTDEKLYDVKLFDYDYDKQRKIEYTGRRNYSYQEMIYSFIVKPNKAKRIRLVGFHDYPKFLEKQMNCPVSIIQRDANGRILKEPLNIFIDVYQNQYHVADSTQEFDIYVSTNIVLDYLMPEAEIIFILWMEQKQ